MSLQSRTSRRRVTYEHWHCESLERRLLLAADLVGPSRVSDSVVVGSQTGESAVMYLPVETNDSATVSSLQNHQTSAALVFIDSEVIALDEVLAAIVQDAEVHLIPSHEDGLSFISRILNTRRHISSVHVISHGRAGVIRLAGQDIDASTILNRKAELALWKKSLSPDADILIYGCDVATGITGNRFVKTLAELTLSDVAASLGKTGHSSLGANWSLEYVVGDIDSTPTLSVPAVEAFVAQLSISIRAAGSTGQESMQLQIDGIAVQTWDNVGGNADADLYQTYTYATNETVSADRVRVLFTNDLYQPGVIDRNLRVDNIRMDGVVYQTESPVVFSTATWKSADGIVPGYRQSEYLHANGYFQYSSQGASPLGSLIQIQAAGDIGTETMQLGIRGQIVQTWNNVGGHPYARDFQTFEYRADDTVLADDIQIYFTNDNFVFGTPDRNLHVDRTSIDGVNYETEAPSVFSTGTYLPGDGIVPGFRSSETLHTEGFFQYSSPQSGTGSLISILAAGDAGTERMELLINDQVVKAWNGISIGAGSRTFQTYNFRASGPVTADQIKVAFTNDGSTSGIDRNVRIDKVILDGLVFEAEAPTVYSTGTWKPSDGIVPGYRESEYLNANGNFQLQARSLNPGVVAIESSVVNSKENDGAVSLSIIRSQGSDGFVSVDYATIASTALVNNDFIATSGTVTFAPGETLKTISIPLVNDAIAEANESFGFAIDNVTGGALLLAPRTATVTITDDDVSIPNYSTFVNSTGLQLNGTSAVANGKLVVNSNASNSIGAAYFNSPIPISNQSSLQVSFQFDINQASSVDPNAGLTFVIQNSIAGARALPTASNSVGYAGVSNSLAIQFDTRLLDGTSNENLVKLLTNGNLAAIDSGRTPLIDFVSNPTAYAWIDYNGSNDTLRVYVSGTASKPASPVLTANIDLASLVGSQAFLGFTGGAGLLGSSNQIRNWSVKLDPPTSGSGGGAPGLLAETIVGNLFQPIAIDWSPDARNLYIAQKNGVVQVVRDGVQQSAPFIDISAIVNTAGDRGLSDIAVHPDFVNNPYFYLLFTYDPPEVNGYLGDSIAGPDGAGNRAGRLIRVTADAATNYTSIVAGSEVVILGANSTWANFNGLVNSTIDSSAPPAGILPDGSNLQDFVASDSTSHGVDSLNFGPDGALYVSIGDGTSFNRVDTRAFRVQDVGNFSGKLLRINPITGAGFADNPFYNGNLTSNQSKVYQYGFRNPFRFSIDSRNNKVYVGDVGWTNWEEINAGTAGANFGWPFYEGGSAGNQQTIQYNVTPEAQAFYASGQIVTAPLIALNHAADNINAIIGGDVYVGSAYPPEYFGDLFFNDLGQGIVRNATLDASGNIEKIEVFATGSTYVVQIVNGPDGRLYYVDLDDGEIGRWTIV